MKLTRKLIVAIKMSQERQYRLAHRIEVHPSVLSAWLNGITDPRAGDPRIIALGRLVGVPAGECFKSDG